MELDMKTRIDFVSNSSSCSFVIHDIKAFNEKLKVLSSAKNGTGIDTFWMYGLHVRFNFKNIENNKAVFKDFLSGYAYKDSEYMYGSGSFEKFLSIDPQYYGQLESVEVYAYDDGGYDGWKKSFLFVSVFSLKPRSYSKSLANLRHFF